MILDTNMGSTHERSSGACEDEPPPMACAKLERVFVLEGGFDAPGVAPPTGAPKPPQPEPPP